MSGLRTAGFVASCVLIAACAGTSPKVEAAQHARYDTDLHTVFTACREVIATRAPRFSASELQRTISTAWQQVRDVPVESEPLDGRSADGRPMRSSTTYFIRYDLTIASGPPWIVTIVAHASARSPNTALPVELDGANEPGWIESRANALRVAIYERLRAFDQPGS